MIYLCLIEPVLWVNLESGTKCFVFEAEIEDEGVLSFPRFCFWLQYACLPHPMKLLR